MNRILAFLLTILTILSTSSYAEEKRFWNIKKDVALQGYDPTAYFEEHVARPGRKEIFHELQGVRFQFATEANRAKFAKDPSRYPIAYGGWCAYAMADGDKVDVDPNTFKILGGQLHLFYNGWLGNTLKKWEAAENELKIKADVKWLELVQKELSKK